MERAETREIDHDQWVPFLAEFSKAHFGEPVKVRVLGRTADAADETAPPAPLMAIDGTTVAAVAAAAADGGERIEVVTGAGPTVSYGVSHPVHVRVSGPSSDQPLTVQIDDEDGSRTLLRFLTEKPGQA